MSVAADTAARAPSVPEGAKALSKAVGSDVPVETTKAMHPAAPGGSALMQRLSIRSRLLVVGSSLGDGVVVVLEPVVNGGGGRGHRS